MKKMGIGHLKLLFIVMIIFSTTGCVSMIQQYSPRRTSGWKSCGWKEFGVHHYKYECNGSAVGVYPIQTKPLRNGMQPVLSIDIHVPQVAEEACNLSCLWLENKNTGQRVNPIKVETYPLTDKTTMLCYYSFDIQGDKNVQYDLYVSDRLLGCPIEPIPYVFEKTWVVQPQDVM